MLYGNLSVEAEPLRVQLSLAAQRSVEQRLLGPQALELVESLPRVLLPGYRRFVGADPGAEVPYLRLQQLDVVPLHRQSGVDVGQLVSPLTVELDRGAKPVYDLSLSGNLPFNAL